MIRTLETDVLIVGAGPAGSICSLLLAQQGISNLMINKWPSTSPGPRAHITNQRAMEILRDVGLEERAKELSTPQKLMGHTWATSIVGEEFGRIYSWSTHPQAKAASELASPCSVCDLPQLYFEPMVVSQCQLAGSDVRFSTEYLSHEQDDAGVTARLRDVLTGDEFLVRSKYLVGADGGRSQVASDINLPFEGQVALGDSGSINIEFTADLSDFVAHRPSDMFWLLQAGSGLGGTGVGVLRVVRPWRKWVCVWGYNLADGPPDMSDENALDVVQKLIGNDEIPITIDAMSTWTINQQYAARNTSGRVFCMGDATHRHTPMSGLGLNTSVQDAYNLAWKLALVVKGHAGADLLKSYDAERTPIARQIVNQAFENMAKLPPMFTALGIPHAPTQKDMDRAVASLKDQTEDGAERRANFRAAMDDTLICFGAGHGTEMNQRYESAAVASDGSEDPGFDLDPVYVYQSSTRPGAHLPHAWLTSGRNKVSTLDLCGKGKFTLLTGLAGSAWEQAAKDVASDLGINIVVHIIGPGQKYVDSWGDFEHLREVSESGALLVRPDMYIGWRAENGNDASRAQLVSAMRQILDRSGAATSVDKRMETERLAC